MRFFYKNICKNRSRSDTDCKHIPNQNKPIIDKIIILHLTSYAIFMYNADNFRYMVSKQSDEFLDEELEDDEKDTEYLNDEFEEDDSKDK